MVGQRSVWTIKFFGAVKSGYGGFQIARKAIGTASQFLVVDRSSAWATSLGNLSLPAQAIERAYRLRTRAQVSVPACRLRCYRAIFRGYSF